jgi:hypothetical protein
LKKALDLALRAIEEEMSTNATSSENLNISHQLLQCIASQKIYDAEIIAILCRNAFVQQALHELPEVGTEQVAIFEQMIINPEIFPLEPLAIQDARDALRTLTPTLKSVVNPNKNIKDNDYNALEKDVFVLAGDDHFFKPVVPGVLYKAMEGISDYRKLSRGFSGRLSFVSFLFDRQRGAIRAKTYKDLINHAKTPFQKMVIIYALLASEDGKTLQNKVCTRMGYSLNAAREIFLKTIAKDLQNDQEKINTFTDLITQIVKNANTKINFVDAPGGKYSQILSTLNDLEIPPNTMNCNK